MGTDTPAPDPDRAAPSGPSPAPVAAPSGPSPASPRPLAGRPSAPSPWPTAGSGWSRENNGHRAELVKLCAESADNPFYGPGNPFYGPDYPFYGPGLFKSRVLVSDQTGLASAHFFYWRYGLITHTGVYRTVLYLICLLGHAQVWMERTAWSACWCGIIVDVAQPAHRAMSMLLSTI